MQARVRNKASSLSELVSDTDVLSETVLVSPILGVLHQLFLSRDAKTHLRLQDADGLLAPPAMLQHLKLFIGKAGVVWSIKLSRYRRLTVEALAQDAVRNESRNDDYV